MTKNLEECGKDSSGIVNDVALIARACWKM